MALTVIGVGPGDPAYTSQKSIELIRNAGTVLASGRLVDDFSKVNENIRSASLKEMFCYIDDAPEDEDIAILATGDVGFYSIASTLRKRYPQRVIRYEAATGSLAYFCAKIGIGYEDMRLVSVHGRDNDAIAFITYNRKVFFLTGGDHKVKDILDDMCASSLGNVTVYVGEDLSYPQEKITSGTAQELKDREFSDLAVMITVNDEWQDPNELPKDEDFLRNKTPITKQDIRDLSATKLEIRPQDIIADIGAGSGSVSIAMARRACEGRVYAIEREDDATDLIFRNIEKFRAHNVTVIKGSAPGAMEGITKLDKAFIGGSGGNLKEILERLLEINPNIRVVINAITLETIAEATDSLKELGFDFEATLINSSHSFTAGRYNLMKADNPIYIFSGEKK